jgi:glycosyltransferase involved in cell wall biosynthesis
MIFFLIDLRKIIIILIFKQDSKILSNQSKINKKPLLSICVPTFNREVLLKKMLDSIGSKYSDVIEVVIVDDGSEDSTENLCNSYIDRYNLKYIFQRNQGRSHALRAAILNATGHYTILMDSDDQFVKKGIETIVGELLNSEKYNKNENFAGMVFLCSDENHNVIGKRFPKNKAIGNIVKDHADNKIDGDKKEVINSELLKKYMYVPFESEKRMATSILWNRISHNYDVLNINQIVAIKIYCDDGLGKNIDKVRMLSCQSSALYYSEALNSHRLVYKSYFFALRMLINLIRYSMHAKTFKFIKKIRFNIVNLFMLIPAVLISINLYLKDKSINLKR